MYLWRCAVAAECKHVNVCMCKCDSANRTLLVERRVRDGGLEGEGDVVSCVVQVRIGKSVCVTRKMSPLHQLRHAEMFLSHSSTVARATELAGPVRNPLLFFCWNFKKEEKWTVSVVYFNTGIFLSESVKKRTDD